MKKFLHLTAFYPFVLATFSFIAAAPANAHHSYAIYDIDNKIERTGTLLEFNFIQPHITMVVEAQCEDGSTETWNIVSLATRLWERAEHDKEFAAIGETVTIVGWPARNGSEDMALSAITSEKAGTMVMRDVINQRGARDNLPEVTIQPGGCQ